MNSYASVLDYEKELLFDLVVIGVYDNFSFKTGVLNGIFYQIYHHLLETNSVTNYGIGEDTQILVISFQEFRKYFIIWVFLMELGQIADHIFMADLISHLLLLDKLLSEVKIKSKFDFFAFCLEMHHIFDIHHCHLQIKGSVFELEFLHI